MFSLKKFINQIRYFRYYKKNKFSGIFSIGKNVSLRKCNVGNYVNFANDASVRDSVVGDYTSIGRYSKIVHTEIGKYCAVSWDTSINALSHPYTHLSISSFAYVPKTGNFVEKREQSYQKVIIKNDVWIGAHAIIMPGILVGNGAVIGAGAIVTKDVPDYAIVTGVPAKVLKYRFSKDIIDRLLKLCWWDLDEELIKQHICLWQSDLTIEMIDQLEDLLISKR